MTASSRPFLILAGMIGFGLVVTLGLWIYYGTTVFFEIVRAGWLACF